MGERREKPFHTSIGRSALLYGGQHKFLPCLLFIHPTMFVLINALLAVLFALSLSSSNCRFCGIDVVSFSPIPLLDDVDIVLDWSMSSSDLGFLGDTWLDAWTDVGTDG
jgi:hypothetical protein